MNVLITGHTGFLGGRIVQYLSGTRKFILKFYPNDITDAWAAGQYRMDDIEAIIHLAANYDSTNGPVDHEKSMRVNSLGTLNMLNAAIAAGVKRFIYFSTVHVYGSPLTGTITEETLPRPLSPYAITHKAAEDWVLAAHTKKEITGIVLRLSNSFGCPANDSKNAWMPIINNMCRQAVETGTITLQSTAVQERDFITVEDVCRAVEHFLSLPEEKCLDGLFNVGGDNTMSIVEAAVEVAYKSDSIRDTRVIPTGSLDTIPYGFSYCIDKLRETGFELTNNVGKEIHDTLTLLMKKHIGDATA